MRRPAPRIAPRSGPRPLPLHLMSAAIAWTSSLAAWRVWNSGSLDWNPALRPRASALAAALENASPEVFAAALRREIASRADAFLSGIERYRGHPYRRTLPEPTEVWRQGTTRLLDYGPVDGAPVLVVPSLINRAYILDLTPEKSLLRHLARTGLRPFLVDWGAPGAEERDFDLTAYIAGRLEAAAETAARLGGARPAVLGYCMGGLLAVALAQRRPDLVSALALLATPWDFHAERAEQARLLGRLAEPLAQICAPAGEVPVDILQMLFLANDPLTAARKFIGLAAMPLGGAGEHDFVALEDWLNDGVPLALPAAREALGGWYGENRPGLGQWRIAGRPVLPREVEAPSLVIVPRQDHIVPPLTAAALADRLPKAERLDPALGHIGMVMGRAAPREVWGKLADWLKIHADKSL
jgi:polyhydroxyalkanoate synthase subunit PhaC